MALFEFVRPMLLTGKSVLITGAANRLGAQIARTLHQNGANLIIHYRNSGEAATSLADELNRERTDTAATLGADLADLAAIDDLARAACSRFDGLDILVNNASSFYPTPFGDIDATAWDDLIASNYRAPLFLSQACYPRLKQSRGCIINLVDIYANTPLPRHSVYCSAKAANQMLIRSLAQELAPDIRVNGIAPGAILWPEDAAAQDPAYQREVLDAVPLQRSGTPMEIADTALFLATNAYITGEVIRVDGGRQLNF